jgi:hypothetical protein
MIINPAQFNFLKLSESCSRLTTSAANLALDFGKEPTEQNRVRLERDFNEIYTQFLLLQVMLPNNFMVPDGTSVGYALDNYEKEVILAQKNESIGVLGGSVLIEAIKALKKTSQKVD